MPVPTFVLVRSLLDGVQLSTRLQAEQLRCLKGILKCAVCPPSISKQGTRPPERHFIVWTICLNCVDKQGSAPKLSASDPFP